MTELTEDLEEAIKILLILGSMGIWFWIALNRPIFQIIDKYISPLWVS